MLLRLSTRRCALLASALAIACERTAAPGTPQRRIDAAAASAAAPPARPTPPDAATDAPATDAPATDAGGPRSPLDLFVVGGADLVRPGASVALRVERLNVGDTQVVDVTRTTTFRVVPATVGRIDRGGVFHGLAAGRGAIVATLGGHEARTIVEVTTELPAGMTAAPTLQMSDGRVAHSVHFSALPDGTVSLEVQATGLALSLRGHRSGNAFPITVPVEAARPPTTTGTLVLDRWLDRHLDGHAELQVAGQPMQLRFTVVLPDAAPLLGRVGP